VPKKDDPKYKRKEAETDNLIDVLVWDATQKSGGGWDNKVVAECYNQFEWLYRQP